MTLGTKVTEYKGVDETATMASGARITELRAGAITNRHLAICDKRMEVIQSKNLGWLKIRNALREKTTKPPLDLAERATSQI